MAETLDIEVHEMTPEEQRELLDTMALHYLGMTFDEFRRAWDAGEFRGDESRPGVERLVAHLRFTRSS